jgi:hypothetical protein
MQHMFNILCCLCVYKCVCDAGYRHLATPPMSCAVCQRGDLISDLIRGWARMQAISWLAS